MSTSILHLAFTLRSCKWAPAPATTTVPFLLVLLPGALFLRFSTQRPQVCPLGFPSGSVLRGSLVLFRSVSPYILPATRPPSPAHFSHLSEALVCTHTMYDHMLLTCPSLFLDVPFHLFSLGQVNFVPSCPKALPLPFSVPSSRKPSRNTHFSLSPLPPLPPPAPFPVPACLPLCLHSPGMLKGP